MEFLTYIEVSHLESDLMINIIHHTLENEFDHQLHLNLYLTLLYYFLSVNCLQIYMRDRRT